MKKNKAKNSNRESRKGMKHKRSIQLLLILILATIILTLVISEYIRGILQGSINTNAIEYGQTLEKNTDTNIDTQNTTDTIQEKETTKDEQTNTTEQDTQDTIDISVFFIQVINETQLKTIKYTRTIPFTLSLLSTTLEELFIGPNNDEKNEGAKTFIPSMTIIRNISISNSTAFLDLSDNFQFNTFGRLGILAQLLQIVYTCTEFQNIDNVQILVEGKKQRSLSGDAGFIAVDKPLTRNMLLRYAENIR